MVMPKGTSRRLSVSRMAAAWMASVSFVCTAAGPADYELLMQSKNDGRAFEEKTWAEMEHLLPPPPKPASLVMIDIGPQAGNKFEVDEESVIYGADEVVRYTLVVTSPQGARNVSFEGMRCATGERRLYAFGRADGGWAKARSDAWVRISENKLNRHHAALFKDYFCTSGGSVMDTAEARRVLRSGNPAAANRP